MPHRWEYNQNKIAVTRDELIPAFFNCLKTLQWNIDKYKNLEYGIKKLQRGCYGRLMLIDFDSLPREIQDALGDPRKCSHIMERWYKTDANAVRVFAGYQFDNGTYLRQEFQDEYIINASVMNALQCFWDAHAAELSKKGKKAKKMYEFVSREAQAFQATLKARYNGIQHTLPTSERWFREVWDKYFTEWEYNGEKYACNYESLISGKLQNENAKIVNDKITALLDSMFSKAGSKPNKLLVARRYQAFAEGMLDVINNETGELYKPEDFKTLSDRTITKWLSTYKSKAATYALRSSDRQRLRGQFTPYSEFELPLYAGSLISVDDRQPPFEYAKSERMWLYNCLDVASDAITATVWGKSKEGMILEFYRQILRNYTQWGIRLPAELEAEMSLNSSFKDTFLKEGAMFDYVRLEANNARGKIIENRNRAFRYQHEKELEGWIGRPFARDESNQPVAKDNIYNERKYISYDKLVQQSLMIIEDWNNMPHPVKKDISRWDYFVSNQNENLHPTNWRAILPHLGYTTKSSCNVGKIRLQGQSMMIADNGEILFGEALINRLTAIEGQNVTIYWLDGNDGNILKALVYMGDQYICEAMPVPKPNRARIERTPEDDIKIQIQAKYTATVEGWIKTRKHSIDAVTLIDNRPKTLNRNFVMPGVNRHEADIDDGVEMLEAPTIEDADTFLPIPTNNKSFVKSTKDRI